MILVWLSSEQDHKFCCLKQFASWKIFVHLKVVCGLCIQQCPGKITSLSVQGFPVVCAHTKSLFLLFNCTSLAGWHCFQHDAASQAGWLEWAGCKKKPSDLEVPPPAKGILPLNPCLCSCTPDSLPLCSVLHEQPHGRGTLVTLCQSPLSAQAIPPT